MYEAKDDEELTVLLGKVSPEGREILRRLMRAEQYERDEFATALEAARTESASDLADLIDLASLNPEVRRRLARLLGEINAHATD